MHIKSIQLKNIRGFEDSGVMEFSPGINLLVGHNNAGKSTVLKTAYMLQSTVLKLSDIRIGQEHGIINIALDNLSRLDKEKYIKQPTPVKTLYINIEDIKDNINMQIGIYPSQISRALESKPDKSSLVLLELAPLSDKQPNNFIYTFLAKRKTYGYSNSNISEDYINTINQDLSNLAARINDIMNSHGLAKYDEYVEACKLILGTGPIVTFPTPHSSNAIIPGTRIDKENKITIEDMGEGIPNILGLIVNLCDAHEGKLFLIEELENDLHPEALKKLLEIIIKKSDKNQFIISTHSNIVTKYLGSIPYTKIFNVTMKLNENRIPTSTIAEVANTSEARIELLEGLGYEVFDFDLHKGYLILEESSAEQIIRDFLIPEFVPGLKWKLRTIAANGIDDVEPRINDFLRLFVYLHTAPIYKNKAWVIVDGDAKGLEILQKIKTKFNQNNGWNNNQFSNLMKDNFERYYPQQFQEEVGRILDLDHTNKREEKKELLKKVITYIQTNKDEAKIEFEKSAKEVIDILKEINTQLQ